MTAERGLDQGCPLSPAFYATATARLYEELAAAALQHDRDARVVAYLDDVFVVGTPQALAAALADAPALLAARGLRLKEDKTKVWNPRGLQLPPSLAAAAVAELKCVGSRLPFVGGGAAADDLDQDPAGTSFGSAAAPEPATRHLHAFLAKLEHLREHGLRLQGELVLLRTFVNGAALHHARAHLLDEAWSRAYDYRVLQHAQGPCRGSSSRPPRARRPSCPWRAAGLACTAWRSDASPPSWAPGRRAWRRCAASWVSPASRPSLPPALRRGRRPSRRGGWPGRLPLPGSTPRPSARTRRRSA